MKLRHPVLAHQAGRLWTVAQGHAEPQHRRHLMELSTHCVALAGNRVEMTWLQLSEWRDATRSTISLPSPSLDSKRESGQCYHALWSTACLAVRASCGLLSTSATSQNSGLFSCRDATSLEHEKVLATNTENRALLPTHCLFDIFQTNRLTIPILLCRQCP
jgi:hypothetical protein